MKKINVGDIVSRPSHGGDILFKVAEIVEENGKYRAILRGLDIRLYADAPIDDLEIKKPSEISNQRKDYIKKNSDCLRRIFERRVVEKKKMIYRRSDKSDKVDDEENFFELPGTVLHFDGDKDYLELCMTTYKQLNIKANGFHVPESKQPEIIEEYLKQYTPDIVVITGHDGLIRAKGDYRNINNYRNSKYFIESVRRARSFEPGRDDLIVIAGACQSYYEAIIDAGANFASSPQRVLIHAFDPVFIVEKLAYTSIYDTLSVHNIIENTITGVEGLGGVDTRGRLRLGFPKSPY